MTSLKERDSTSVIQSPSAPKSTALSPASHLQTPSRLRKVGRFILRHPRLTQTAVFLILFSGTSLFLLYSLFKGAWSPHQDNVAVLKTILKMELNRENSQLLGLEPHKVVTRSYQSLDPHVASDGWVWINRFGGTITYGKQEQRLIASCSTYSPLYLVCNLSEIP